jgi:hypothetical protein
MMFFCFTFHDIIHGRSWLSVRYRSHTGTDFNNLNHLDNAYRQYDALVSRHTAHSMSPLFVHMLDYTLRNKSDS